MNWRHRISSSSSACFTLTLTRALLMERSMRTRSLSLRATSTGEHELGAVLELNLGLVMPLHVLAREVLHAQRQVQLAPNALANVCVVAMGHPSNDAEGASGRSRARVHAREGLDDAVAKRPKRRGTRKIQPRPSPPRAATSEPSARRRRRNVHHARARARTQMHSCRVCPPTRLARGSSDRAARVMNFDPPTCSCPPRTRVARRGPPRARRRAPHVVGSRVRRRVADTAAASSSALASRPGRERVRTRRAPPRRHRRARLSLVSTARVAALHVVHPTLRERAYVRTVRGADVPDANHHTSHDASTSSDPASAPATPLLRVRVDPRARPVRVRGDRASKSPPIRRICRGRRRHECSKPHRKKRAPPASRPSFVKWTRAPRAPVPTRRFIAGLSSPGMEPSGGRPAARAASVPAGRGRAYGGGGGRRSAARAARARLLDLDACSARIRRARRDARELDAHGPPPPSIFFRPGTTRPRNRRPAREDARLHRAAYDGWRLTALRVERVVTDAMDGARRD